MQEHFMVSKELIAVRFQLADALCKQTSAMAGVAVSIMNQTFSDKSLEVLENFAVSLDRLSAFMRKHIEDLKASKPHSLLVKS